MDASHTQEETRAARESGTERFDYLIIGAGMAADTAARGIREIDATGSIGILGAEDDEPYARPPLSKLLWLNPDAKLEDFFTGTAEATGAQVRTGTTVTGIDRENRRVSTANGQQIGYGKLLLATGAEPNRLDAPQHPHILTYRTAEDYRRLRELTRTHREFVLLGGGYIGAELAAVLSQEDVSVHLIIPETTLGDAKFPADLAVQYQALLTDAGVQVSGGHRAERADVDGDRIRVRLDDGTDVEGDVLILGLGATPRTELAEAAGLELADGGVRVDEQLRTSDPHIWAAGDIASYPDVILGRTRVEHKDNALQMGTTAGRSMASGGERYAHTPYFYSLVNGTRWEAVGTLDSTLETLEDDLGDGRRVVYYLDADRRPVGVLLWKVEDAVDAAREVLAAPPADPEQLRGRIG
ncbi:NAD(P)/FAD-dependent oxidoreductase [Rothia kristinae]|uniref:NAD(P)/FAD-dependent oxidoreductase n=1 Tax=Rothia kristinae TaxID=37923 RepID=UPI0022DFE695|nr:NAD(P)/FAD-dependent oxidoreductase [Rothia kristinae]